VLERKCSRCDFWYEGEDITELSTYFPRDKRKTLGLAHCCKACKAAERRAKRDQENARWERYYSKGSYNYRRHLVRVATRSKYGPARKHLCAECALPADEWHHVEYEVDKVVALCHFCHEAITRSGTRGIQGSSR
jgi:hypothetical protein